MTGNANCLACHSKRSVRGPRKGPMRCKVCGAMFFIATRKKKFFPTPEVQKILGVADRYRDKQIYSALAGKFPTEIIEDIRDTMKGKMFKFRHGNGHLENDDGTIYFVGRVQVGPSEEKTIRGRTNMSIEEYKLYLAADPDRNRQTIYLAPHPPYNIHVFFMKRLKTRREKPKG